MSPLVVAVHSMAAEVGGTSHRLLLGLRERCGLREREREW